MTAEDVVKSCTENCACYEVCFRVMGDLQMKKEWNRNSAGNGHRTPADFYRFVGSSCPHYHPLTEEERKERDKERSLQTQCPP